MKFRTGFQLELQHAIFNLALGKGGHVASINSEALEVMHRVTLTGAANKPREFA